MTSSDGRVEELFDRAWRQLVRQAPVGLVVQLAKPELIKEGRTIVQQAIEEGLDGDQVIDRVTNALLRRSREHLEQSRGDRELFARPAADDSPQPKR